MIEQIREHLTKAKSHQAKLVPHDGKVFFLAGTNLIEVLPDEHMAPLFANAPQFLEWCLTQLSEKDREIEFLRDKIESLESTLQHYRGYQ